MSRQRDREELKEIEAELASLTPRSGGLDPGFPSLLAREAALTAEMAAKQGMRPAGAALSTEKGICPCCGHRSPHGLKRWVWPGAFSAMSAIAATLLAIVIARPAPRTAEVAVAPAPAPAPETHQKLPDVGVGAPVPPIQSSDDAERPSSRRYGSVGWVSRPDLDGVGWVSRPVLDGVGWVSNPRADGSGEPSYMWQSLPLPSGPEPDIATVPLSSRELLEQLLKDPLAGGEVRAATGLEPVKPSGARS